MSFAQLSNSRNYDAEDIVPEQEPRRMSGDVRPTIDPRGEQFEDASVAGKMRYMSLDGLRGIAAVVVLLHHSLLLFPALAAPYFGRPESPPRLSWAWWLVDTPLHPVLGGRRSCVHLLRPQRCRADCPCAESTRFSWRGFYPQRLIRLTSQSGPR